MRAASSSSAGFPSDAPVERDGRIDAESDPSVGVYRASLSLRVPADELGWVGIGQVVFDVVGRDDLERDRELLEDRPSLRRGRRQSQPVLRATHRSSLGHFRAHATVAVSVVRVIRGVVGCIQLHEALDLEPGRARRTSIHSPWPKWNSGRPRAPTRRRTSLAAAAAGLSVAVPGPHGTHRVASMLFVRKTSRPPGRRSLAASGIQRAGSHQRLAPYSGEGEVEARIG